MSEICPICNGLYEKIEVCSKCGARMDQAGKLEDYNGPYSPYVGQDTFVLNNDTTVTGDNCCIHLYVCPNCSNLQHGAAQLVSM
jgi:hypothetical protein